MKRYFVYILLCADGSYYTGVTNDLDRRLLEHEDGLDPSAYTYRRRPVKLVFHNNFRRIEDAIVAEKQLKGWSRKKKEALINGNWDLIRQLAVCQNESNARYYNKPGFDSAQPDSNK